MQLASGQSLYWFARQFLNTKDTNEVKKKGSLFKFFPFRVDPFPEGKQNNLTQMPPLKVSPFTLNLISDRSFTWA